MKKFLKVVLILVVIVAILLGVILLTLSGQTKNKEIKFGDDLIPTLYSVVGERKIVGTSVGTEGNTQYKEYTYEEDVVSINDIEEYVKELQEEDFVVIEASSDVISIAIESKDDGKIVIATIDYSDSSVVVKYQKTVGTLTRF